MAVEKELVHSRSDQNFRKGACHAAKWFSQTSRMLAEEGRTAEEISDHFADMLEVLQNWRGQTCELPDGNPWDWSFKDLSDVIRTMKAP